MTSLPLGSKRPQGRERILSVGEGARLKWSVDRLGRSLQNLVAFLGELRAKGVILYLHQQGLDTATPAGTAMFQMLGVFAEFERAMIVEQVKAGLSQARSQGKRLGRQPVSAEVVERIRDESATGADILKTTKDLASASGEYIG